MLGQIMSEEGVAINKGINKIQMDYSNLASGTYILIFSDSTGKMHQAKFVKD